MRLGGDHALQPPPALEVDQLVVRFGGNVAVDQVSIQAPQGRLTGLIGPNGAGKTTTFNACAGLLRPSAGTVRLFGHDAGRLGPAARARRGLGRTFQRMELFDSLRVVENVAAGREAAMAGANPFTMVVSSRRQRENVMRAAEDAIARCGLEALAGRRVGSLSTGQRRLVELARALAGDFPLLLLDEPSSGLDPAETEHLGAILREVVAEQGRAILLVEHDMTLVMRICDSVYVLDFGRPIFEGIPAEVQRSDLVRSAYLGSAAPGSALEELAR